jgi:hypothetical protein
MIYFLFISVFGNDILINQKDFPDVILRDVLEIHHPDSDYRYVNELTLRKD